MDERDFVEKFRLDQAKTRMEDDKEFYIDLCETFFEDYPARQLALRAAVESGDAKVCVEVAHSMKGALANLSAVTASNAAYELEQIGRTGNVKDAQTLLVKLEEEVDIFKKFLAFVQRSDVWERTSKS